jgi:quercetin dioxygenase-like cupin family protein
MVAQGVIKDLGAWPPRKEKTSATTNSSPANGANMYMKRIFKAADFLQPANGEPIRSVITESADAAIIAWVVLPGQSISAHVHPDGQDTWTILSGQGQYRVDANGNSAAIAAGDVVVAGRNEVHGVLNDGNEPLVFVSVVSPAAAGYALLAD